MREENVQFTNNKGQKLAGVFHIPEGDGSFPIVVYLHGYRSDKTSSKIAAVIEQLPEFVAFRYDAMGHGESEGDFTETTVSQWVEDMKTAIEFVKSKPSVDKEKIGLYGSSLGGMTVLLTASGRDDLKGITPVCPVSDFKNTTSKKDGHVDEWKERGFKFEYSRKEDKEVKINYTFYSDGVTHDVYEAATQIQCLGLVVHGTADPIVPFPQSEELVKHNNLLKLHPIPGADHLFTEEPHFNEVVNEVAKFFKEQLQ